ncbi:unnamed protein product, partial [Ectocarpus sp. 4 AP-2014]
CTAGVNPPSTQLVTGYGSRKIRVRSLGEVVQSRGPKADLASVWKVSPNALGTH